jgi:uncharacterized membrane protein
MAALLWVGVHVGIAGTRLRARVVRATGERGFSILFSLLSVATIAFLCASYNRAPLQPLWFAPTWLLWVLAALMLPAAVLFAGSVMIRNPTGIGGAGAEPRGMTLLTRHPMLWSFALWSFVHVAGNGDLASTLFFGAFLVTALAGMPSIDAKLAARDPVTWKRLAATTSIVPGGKGWPLRRIGVEPVIAGAALWVVMFFGHPYVIGVSAVR